MLGGTVVKVNRARSAGTDISLSDFDLHFLMLDDVDAAPA